MVNRTSLYAALLVSVLLAMPSFALEEENITVPTTVTTPKETAVAKDAIYTRHDSSYAVAAAPDLKPRDPKHTISGEMVRAAVEIIASERWKEFAIGTPIPCSDENGFLVAFHVPVAIN